MATDGLMAEDAQTEYGDVLEPVIPLLLAGSYVLTDPRGAITGWGVQAEALFGQSADDVRGLRLTATLTGSDHGEDPVSLLVNDSRLVAASVEIEAKDRNGDPCPCALSVVPIDLRHGLAFSGLIRDLEAAAARDGEIKMRDAHYGVLQILGATLAGEEPEESDGRLAGVMVLVRPLEDPDWLPDAKTAAVRSRAGGRRAVAITADEEGGPAAAAERLAQAGEIVGRIEEVGHTADEALRRSVEASADLAGLSSRIDDLVSRITEREQHAAQREETHRAELTERLEALTQRVMEGEVADAARLEDLQARLADREQTSGDAARGGEQLRGDLEALLAATNEAQARAEQATADSEAARAAAEHAAAAASAALAQAEQAGSEVAAASRELSEAGARLVRGSEPARVNGISRNTKSGREPIAGFDDVSSPIARLDLDGRYRMLNDRFAELVGFSEQQFRSASWPSLIDRDNRESHEALHAEIRGGTRDEAHVQTFYTGGAGLLVEVSGRVSLVRDESGEPEHLLFELDQF